MPYSGLEVEGELLVRSIKYKLWSSEDKEGYNTYCGGGEFCDVMFGVWFVCWSFFFFISSRFCFQDAYGSVYESF